NASAFVNPTCTLVAPTVLALHVGHGPGLPPRRRHVVLAVRQVPPPGVVAVAVGRLLLPQVPPGVGLPLLGIPVAQVKPVLSREQGRLACRLPLEVQFAEQPPCHSPPPPHQSHQPRHGERRRSTHHRRQDHPHASTLRCCRSLARPLLSPSPLAGGVEQ